MDMIRHHDPSVEPITLPVEMQKGIFHPLAYAWIAQPTFAVPRIKRNINTLAPFVLALVLG